MGNHKSGRKPEPTSLAEARGNKRKDRQRGSAPTPSAGIGPPPDILDEQERAAWDELVELTPSGILGNSDRWALEIAVRLMVSYRRDPDGTNAATLNRLYALLSSFGLTPADRQRLSVPDDGKGKDGWETF